MPSPAAALPAVLDRIDAELDNSLTACSIF